MFTNNLDGGRVRLGIAVTALLAVLALSACVAVAPPHEPDTTKPSEQEMGSAPPEITISARDFAFDLPAEIPSGWVSLKLSNEGEINHHGVVMRLLDGVSVDDALAAIDDPEANMAEFSDLTFFLPDTDPGKSNEATVEMAPGHWVIFSVSMDSVSIGASEEPTPDFMLGSIQEFDVVEANAMASPPAADLTLVIGPEDFNLQEEIEPGPHTIEVVNESGEEDGYAFMLKMEGDANISDVLAMFDALFSGQEMDMEDMPVFSAVGGLMGYNLGEKYFTMVDLEPGNYTVVSSVNGTDFPYSGLSKDFIVVEDKSSADGGESSPDAIPELLIEVSENGIMAPEDAPGGIVHVTVENTGEQTHTMQLWRIRDGHSREEVIAMNDYLKEHPDDFLGIFDLGSWIHYADDIQPGAIHQFYADLGTGDFFLSDETNPDQGPVFFSATVKAGVTEPTAGVSVDMADFAYAMPDVIPAGELLWEFTNSGDQWHLAAIINDLPDGSLEDILAVFGDEEEPPDDSAIRIFGGMPPMSPGERVWMSFDLRPGAYELVCPLPDIVALTKGDGPPVSHLDHGMRRAFQVENQ